MEDILDMSKPQRSPVFAVIITLLLGVFMGYMYTGFAKKGAILYAIQLGLLFTATLLLNVSILAGMVLLALVIPFILFVLVDVVRMSREGTLQHYHKWYYYIPAYLIVRIIHHLVPIVIKSNIALAFFVPTSAMEPNIIPGDRVIGGVLSAKLHEPERGDIIAFLSPEGKGQIPFLKRVVAVGGDSVEIKDGHVLINNRPEKPVAGVNTQSHQDFELVRVPKESYFVLGDNRINSYDSTKWKNPFVPRKNVCAIVRFRFWPPSRFGRIP